MAIACIAGSMIAANENLGVDHGRAYVFHTWWFLGLMGLLLVNLCLCSWEKSYIALTLYKKKNAVATPNFYRKAAHAVAIPWKGSVQGIENLLRRSYTVVHRKGQAFYAQKGLFGRCGSTIIHIGLLWTITAGYYRILADELEFGVFDSTVILPEGQATNVHHTRKDRLKGPTHDNLSEKLMPFSLRVLDFSADYYPHSTVARHFASLVELRDGDHTEIQEVTMTNPMLYKGYKITQNSFSPNERIVRGNYRVYDRETQTAVELDAGTGDPVRIKMPKTQGLFFQVDAMQPGATYHIVNLAQQSIVETGNVRSNTGPAPLNVNLSTFEQPLKQSQYSFLVAALFPNFTFDEDQQPTTRDENFDNPAVLVMLFKKGEPNGYTWLFLNEDAQDIMGQPHPEVDLFFRQYRQKEGASGEGGLYDFEVEVELREKGSENTYGTFWAKPGEVQEVSGMPEAVLSAPNISTPAAGGHGATMNMLGHSHEGHTHGVHAHDHGNNHGEVDDASSAAPTTTADDESTTRGGAETTASVAGGGQAPGAAEGTSAASNNAQSNRFEITWLGQTTGHVTFLGFMKDPSVSWLFAGCCIIIFGTLIAFMIVYREVWVYHDEEAGILYMATAVRGTSPGAHREFDRRVEQIKALALPVTDRDPDPDVDRDPAPETETEPLVTA